MQKNCERTNTADDGAPTPPGDRSDPSIPSIERLGMTYGLDEEDDVEWSDAIQDNEVRSVEQEFQAYVTESRSLESDILQYWKVSTLVQSLCHLLMNVIPQLRQTSFPTLYAMAMDYLPIQASSVSCERVFSSSSETDTKKRNRINGLLMEALQMLKFALKRDRLNVNERFPNTVEKDMIYDDLTPVYTSDRLPPPSLLAELADAISGSEMQNVLDRAIAATEPVAADDMPVLI